ncbi:MAG: hypothetical protein WD708_05010 [Kiritimatiellia bacterium]
MSSSKDKVMWLMLYRLLKSQQRGLTRPLRIQATLLYVQAVQAARCSVMGLLGFCILYLFLFTGFILFHVGLFFTLPGTLTERGVIFMWLGGGYVVAMLLLCAFALSQKRWMKMTGADKAVLKALE